MWYFPVEKRRVATEQKRVIYTAPKISSVKKINIVTDMKK